jgi:four helix bundle protein
MNKEELKQRTKEFGLQTIKLIEQLPNSRTANMIGNQLLRSATSVGANYRAACRGRSKPDFISKIGIAVEEADESLYWLEIFHESGLIPKEEMALLMQEGNEIIAILTATIKTARNNPSSYTRQSSTHGRQSKI